VVGQHGPAPASGGDDRPPHLLDQVGGYLGLRVVVVRVLRNMGVFLVVGAV
jgi:hypothetical protein